LSHSSTPYTFVTACDLPFLDPSIIRHLCHLRPESAVAVVPFSEGGMEPLHALYESACKEIFECAIRQGERKIVAVLGRMNIVSVSYDEVRRIGGQSSSFINVNTPEEYAKLSLVT
jgi:molybdopterin-guanine dinucleotide biosynthesis protein A